MENNTNDLVVKLCMALIAAFIAYTDIPVLLAILHAFVWTAIVYCILDTFKQWWQE